METEEGSLFIPTEDKQNTSYLMANCPKFAFCHGGCRISLPLWQTSVSWPAKSFKFNEL